MKIILKKAKLNLCDLAGSEKWNKDYKMSKKHIKELKNINLSLTCLGKVISALSKKKIYIPFRESKLTRILQESLSGNNFTTLIATISPLECYLSETISTLKFASKA